MDSGMKIDGGDQKGKDKKRLQFTGHFSTKKE